MTKDIDLELTDEERKEFAEQIGEVMGKFIEDGMTNTNQLDICHQCGKMRLYCPCVNCNCTNCKTPQNEKTDGNVTKN